MTPDEIVWEPDAVLIRYSPVSIPCGSMRAEPVFVVIENDVPWAKELLEQFKGKEPK